jgi:Protein of unknown function (DUF3105)
MAKKRKRRRPSQRPAQRAGTATAASAAETSERTVSARAERKEQARRERERRIKQARRHQRIRRATRWGIAAVVVVGVGAFVWVQTRGQAELQQRAREAARQIACTQPQQQPDAGRSHQPPFVQGQDGIPATSGAHSNALPPDPSVYTQPVPEANAVHNLEHGYVLVYYADSGDSALPDDTVSELEGLVDSEGEVIMAPYPGLNSSLALASWRQLQTCDPPENADPEDVVTVAEAFIDRFRNGPLAPEAAAA